MTVNEIINDCKFCSINNMVFQVSNDQEIPYYCCKRSMQRNCRNHLCNACKEIFARYVIIDLLDDDIYKVCNEVILKSYDNFIKFQRDFLSNIFFYESDFVRYNIYLIFVCENPALDLYNSYSSNMDYARKLFLTKEELKKYFCFYEEICSLSSNEDNNTEENPYRSLKQIEMHLKDKGLQSLLFSKLEVDIFFKYLASDITSLDEIYKKKNLQHYNIERKNVNQTNRNNNKLKVKNIKKFILKLFRTNCFERNTTIPCGMCNVIFGSNTTGKTSLLDAIEYGCTGMSANTKNNNEVDIFWDTGTKISSKDVKHLKTEIQNTWYPYKVGSLNQIFRQVNYFDIDATYRFALEGNNARVAQSYITGLFCDTKLIQIQQNLIRNKESLEFILAFFNDTLSRNNRVLNTKQKSKDINLLVKIINRFFPNYNYFQKKRKKKLMMYHTSINKQLSKLKDLINADNEALKKVESLINKQMLSSIELVNVVFSKLFSYRYKIIYEEGKYILLNCSTNYQYSVNTMSTAQRVCLAMSVIFAKFFSSSESPRIILLDESVANLDSIHLLNLLDFLRDISIEKIQVFFTTANEDVCKIAKSKFAFLNDDFYLHTITKGLNQRSHIESKNCIKI